MANPISSNALAAILGYGVPDDERPADERGAITSASNLAIEEAEKGVQRSTQVVKQYTSNRDKGADQIVGIVNRANKATEIQQQTGEQVKDFIDMYALLNIERNSKASAEVIKIAQEYKKEKTMVEQTEEDKLFASRDIHHENIEELKDLNRVNQDQLNNALEAQKSWNPLKKIAGSVRAWWEERQIQNVENAKDTIYGQMADEFSVHQIDVKRKTRAMKERTLDLIVAEEAMLLAQNDVNFDAKKLEVLMKKYNIDKDLVDASLKGLDALIKKGQLDANTIQMELQNTRNSIAVAQLKTQVKLLESQERGVDDAVDRIMPQLPKDMKYTRAEVKSVLMGTATNKAMEAALAQFIVNDVKWGGATLNNFSYEDAIKLNDELSPREKANHPVAKQLDQIVNTAIKMVHEENQGQLHTLDKTKRQELYRQKYNYLIKNYETMTTEQISKYGFTTDIPPIKNLTKSGFQFKLVPGAEWIFDDEDLNSLEITDARSVNRFLDAVVNKAVAGNYDLDIAANQLAEIYTSVADSMQQQSGLPMNKYTINKVRTPVFDNGDWTVQEVPVQLANFADIRNQLLARFQYFKMKVQRGRYMPGFSAPVNYSTKRFQNFTNYPASGANTND